MVEQYTDNVKVGGSNPPRLTLQPTAAIIILLILGLDRPYQGLAIIVCDKLVHCSFAIYSWQCPQRDDRAPPAAPRECIVIRATKRVIL